MLGKRHVGPALGKRPAFRVQVALVRRGAVAGEQRNEQGGRRCAGSKAAAQPETTVYGCSSVTQTS
jgi:hypothetical protein